MGPRAWTSILTSVLSMQCLASNVPFPCPLDPPYCSHSHQDQQQRHLLLSFSRADHLEMDLQICLRAESPRDKSPRDKSPREATTVKQMDTQSQRTQNTSLQGVSRYQLPTLWSTQPVTPLSLLKPCFLTCNTDHAAGHPGPLGALKEVNLAKLMVGL